MPRLHDTAAEREAARIHAARVRAVERIDVLTARVADLEREARDLPAYFPASPALVKARHRLAYFTAAAVRDGLMRPTLETAQ